MIYSLVNGHFGETENISKNEHQQQQQKQGK